MHIYKLVFDTEQQGKQILIDNNVWEEVTEQGVTTLQYINGTKGVVNCGKIINKQATTDPEHPIYYPGYAYDVMSTDELDLEQYRVYPNGSAAYMFYGYKRDDDK